MSSISLVTVRASFRTLFLWRARYSEKWKVAMKKELRSWIENETFDMDAPPEPPPGITLLETHWVYDKKLDAAYDILHKARVVAGGDKQEQGINYDETYASVATHTALRMLLAMAALCRWNIRQYDIATAFLNSFTDNPNI